MKRFANLCLVIMLSLPMKAYCGLMDSDLVSEFKHNLELQVIPDVAVPVRDDGGFITLRSDYFPIEKRAAYVYEYTSTEFDGVKTVKVELLNYSEKNNLSKFKKTVIYNNNSSDEVYEVYITADGVYSTNGPLSDSRMEFPIPTVVGAVWNRDRSSNTVSSLTARIKLPAGSFSNCLKITTKIADGDAGISKRYYAPGIGLVYEQIMAEDSEHTLKLVSYQIE